MAKEDVNEFKYGIDDFAKLLGVQAASARVQLRKNGIKKQGSSYGWNSTSAMNDDKAKIEAGRGSAKASTGKKGKAAKPEKKAKGAKAAKPKKAKAPKETEQEAA